METTIYWIIEYLKVLLSYGFIMFLWPTVVFYKLLKGKSKTFWFGFCTTASIVIATTLVLFLGLFHILNPWLVRIFYYGSFIVSLIVQNRHRIAKTSEYKKIYSGTYGRKTFFVNVMQGIGQEILKDLKALGKVLISRKTEYIFLLVIVIWGVIYFSWGGFQDYSFGFGDLYVHHKWIYGLSHGQIFVEGIYPEGMHCFIYLFNTLFGVEVYSVLLFIAGIHTFTFFISVYVFLKEIFNTRFTVMLVLMLFLSIDVVCIDEVYSMSRLQWTLPQEFAFSSVLICGAFLLRYLKDDKRTSWKKMWNENLPIFMLAIATSLSVHYYATIIAFFVCLVIIIPYMNKIVKFSNFRELFIMVVLSLVISVTPIAGALATGYQFQKSIDWALSVIEDSDPNASISITDKMEFTAREDMPGRPEPVIEEKEEETEEVELGPSVPQKLTFKEKVQKAVNSIKGRFTKLYYQTYYTVYKQERANLLLAFTLFSACLWIVCKIAFAIIEKKAGKKMPDMKGYLIMIIISVFFMIMYNPTALGIPSIIAGSRLCAFNRIWNFSMICIALDLIGTFLVSLTSETIVSLLAMIGVVAIYVGTVATGNYRGYLYYELTRYNGAVMTTKSITDNLPKDSFTIVSTVDELYTVFGHGFHEEALEFVNKCNDDTYKLTTPYVMIYIEKHPIKYAQNHFFNGPRWLAANKYPSYYGDGASVCPEIIKSDLIEIKKFNHYSANSRLYNMLTTRTEIESELYTWCQMFMEQYPGEMHVYYEDEDFVCYYFEQNPRSLYELAILRK